MKGSNSLDEWIPEKKKGAEKVETEKPLEEFYYQGEQRDEAGSGGRCRIRRVFPLPGGRCQCLCLMGMIQKWGVPVDPGEGGYSCKSHFQSRREGGRACWSREDMGGSPP